MTLTIGKDGRVVRCRVIMSSGDLKTDEATCKIVKDRARYKPALDRYGYPTEVEVRPPPIIWRIES